MNSISLRLLAGALLLASPFALSAQVPTPPHIPRLPLPPSDSALRITLLTMGPGSDVYERFGHNAIWVHDPSRDFPDVVYNWGVFDFRTPGFLIRFLMGDMRYTMAADPLDNTIAFYTYHNRNVWAQDLDLTPPEKRALVDFVRWNVRPENAQYRYDYYLDNCSTRVRDVIDRVVGGQLRSYLRGIPTTETYRSHSLRLMQEDRLLVTGVEMALGRGTDLTLNADQASFLPGQLMQYVRGLKLDGGSRALVSGEYTVVRATRPPEATAAPAMWKALLPIGLAFAAAVVVLGLGDAAGRRRALATVVAVLAALYGLLGAAITFLVTLTDHVAAHANENMFMLNPLWLVVAVALPLALLRGRAGKVARGATVGAAILGLGALLFHLVGLSRQPNWDVIGLLLPSQLAMAAIALRRVRASATTPSATPAI